MHDFAKYRSSAIALVGANLLPLLGVLFLGWSTFAIVALYWAENLVVGAINVLKIITCRPDEESLRRFTNPMAAGSMAASPISASPVVDETGTDEPGTVKDVTLSPRQQSLHAVHAAVRGIKFVLVPFFVFHYGIFCLVHGAFVFALLGSDDPTGGSLDYTIPAVWGRFTQDDLHWSLLILAASHLYSFFVNYIGGGEFRRSGPIVLMFRPYQRIVILHVAILFGAFVTIALGSPIFILVILIALKIGVDLWLHLRERRVSDTRDVSSDVT